MAISSIHFAAGHSGYFDHNSREAETNNAIFKDEKNYCSANKKEAFEIFNKELKLRKEAYENRTGQKLQKNTKQLIYLLSLISTKIQQSNKLKKFVSILKKNWIQK